MEGARRPNYLVLQSPSPPTRQKWIPSPLWGEQQIGEISPNNHRYLSRRREADIYHWGKDPSSERALCVRVCLCVNECKEKWVQGWVFSCSFSRVYWILLKWEITGGKRTKVSEDLCDDDVKPSICRNRFLNELTLALNRVTMNSAGTTVTGAWATLKHPSTNQWRQNIHTW